MLGETSESFLDYHKSLIILTSLHIRQMLYLNSFVLVWKLCLFFPVCQLLLLVYWSRTTRHLVCLLHRAWIWDTITSGDKRCILGCRVMSHTHVTVHSWLDHQRQMLTTGVSSLWKTAECFHKTAQTKTEQAQDKHWKRRQSTCNTIWTVCVFFCGHMLLQKQLQASNKAVWKTKDAPPRS